MKRYIFWAALVLLGILLGAASTTVLVGAQLDDLHIQNQSLQANLAAMDAQVQQLQQTPKKRVISRINTKVNFVDADEWDGFTRSTLELSVEKHIREWLAGLNGQAVTEVNYMLIPQIVDNREIEIDKQKMRLVVRMVIISETVTVYVDVFPLTAPAVAGSRTNNNPGLNMGQAAHIFPGTRFRPI